MAQVIVSLASLLESEPELGILFDQYSRRCADDCDDRCGIKKARKIVLAFDFVPVSNGKELDSVELTYEMKCSVPAQRRPRPKCLTVRKHQGQQVFAFNSESDDSPYQLGFADVDPATGKATQEVREVRAPKQPK